MPSTSHPDGNLSIGQVVALLGHEFPDLTDSKVRFLESQQLISPGRTVTGHRSFRVHDVAVLHWILTRQRDQYLPLSIIGERIERGEHLRDIWESTGGNAGVRGPDVPADGALVDTPPAGNSVTEFVAVEGDVGPQDEAAAALNDPSAPAADGLAPSDDGRLEPNTADAESAVDGPQHLPGVLPDDPLAELIGDRLTAPGEGPYTIDELAEAAGWESVEVARLAEFGLLRVVATNPLEPAIAVPAGGVGANGAASDDDVEHVEYLYGADALAVTRIAREFAAHGLGARHLRTVRNAAQRDTAMFVESLQPMVLAGGPNSQSEARATLERMALLAQRLRQAFLQEAIEGAWQ